MKTLRVVFLLMITGLLLHTSDFVSGQTTCPSSGNKQVSSTSVQVYQLTVTANASNTGQLWLGSSTVAVGSGGYLTPGGTYNAAKPNPAVNPSALFFACSVNSDGLSWIGSR